jgi:hypothetical protein
VDIFAFAGKLGELWRGDEIEHEDVTGYSFYGIYNIGEAIS